MSVRYRFAIACLMLPLLAISAQPVDASSVLRQNIVDLLSLSETIIKGTVVSVTDGLDANNVPYTEVTIDVEENFGGDRVGLYTFRQFGLLAPRQMPDGRTNLNVTPDGWPTYSQGESVILFLYTAAAWTGLRTTVGLFQGKFGLDEGSVRNLIDNEGLFNGVAVDKSLLDAGQEKMLMRDKGAIREDVFTSFLRRAVDESWVEKGVLHHAR
jgi:hypothetical protein